MKLGWKMALRDAEEGIKRASRELADWKAVAAICRRRVAQRAAWPGEVAIVHKEKGKEKP
jgi:hypothetical protein